MLDQSDARVCLIAHKNDDKASFTKLLDCVWFTVAGKALVFLPSLMAGVKMCTADSTLAMRMMLPPLSLCMQCMANNEVPGATVHDTENLTFSAEFRDCSARNDAEFPRGCHGTSARAPRNFRAG